MTDLHADELMGIRGLKQAAVFVGVAVGLLAAAWGVGYLQGARSGEVKASQAEQQAQEHKGRADAAVEAARRAEASESALRSRLMDADEKSNKAAALVAQLRNRPVPAPGVVPPADPGPLEPLGLIDALTAQVEAQQEQIRARDGLILNLTTFRDAWKAAHDDRQREAVALRLALDAQKAAINGARWRGRIEGFAVGAGLGFFAGRH